MRPKCSSFAGRLLSLYHFSLLHWHQSPLVCQQCYLSRWNLSCLLIHLPPELWKLCWLLACSWGPYSYPCGPSDQAGLNYLQPCWSSLASVAGDGWEEPGHLQSPGHQVGSKESTVFHFLSGLWMSSMTSWWPVGIEGRQQSSLSHSCVYLKGIYQLATTDHSACHSTVGASNDAGDLWYAIVSQQFPEALSVQTVKCLLIINRVVIEKGVPFVWLF